MLLSLFYEKNSVGVFFEGVISMVVDQDGCFKMAIP